MTTPENPHTITSILHKLIDHVPWYNDEDQRAAKDVVSAHFDTPPVEVESTEDKDEK